MIINGILKKVKTIQRSKQSSFKRRNTYKIGKMDKNCIRDWNFDQTMDYL